MSLSAYVTNHMHNSISVIATANNMVVAAVNSPPLSLISPYGVPSLRLLHATRARGNTLKVTITRRVVMGIITRKVMMGITVGSILANVRVTKM
jgi:YVTN family beta-propeller protein